MFFQPIQYVEPVFRPPSEARSLILQVTNGCSHNECTFCEMYTQPQKKFSVKDPEILEKELALLSSRLGAVRRIFLADGDAMVLSFRRLKEVMGLVRKYFPDVERVAAYCLPRNTVNKTVDELAELKEMGLSLVYVGCESGDDEVLAKVNKKETFESSKTALLKLGEAGIARSVMILNGLGGVELSQRHAANSARLMNETRPEYLSTLVVSFPLGDARFKRNFPEFKLPDTRGLIKEMRDFMAPLELEGTIFRSDHASNYLVLRGTLNEDKDSLVAQIDAYLKDPDSVRLRPEWMRGL